MITFDFIKNLAKPQEKPQTKVLTYDYAHLEYWDIRSCHINNAPVCINKTCDRKCSVCKHNDWAEAFANSETSYFIESNLENHVPPSNDLYDLETIFMTPSGRVKHNYGRTFGISHDWQTLEDFNIDSLKGTTSNSRSQAFINGTNLEFGADYKNYCYVFNVFLAANWDELALSIFIGKAYFKFQFENFITVPIVNYENYRLKLCSNSTTNLENVSIYNKNTFNFYDTPCNRFSELGIPELAMDKINEILKAFIVKKFGKDTCPDFTAKKLLDAFALAYFPTEPRLFYLMNNWANPNYNYQTVALFTDMDVSCKDDRDNLSIFYKHFGNIPDSIKKMYRNKPENLTGYICLHKAGITDINFIRNLLDAQNKWIDSKGKNIRISQVEMYVYLERIIPVLQNDFNCTQKKIIRILYNNKPCATHEWKDSITMFLQGYTYFTHDSDFVRTFMNDGICHHTHDLLSSELDKLKKENVPFNLRESQKTRYEHEIEGFSFKLAENSRRLVEIGSYMGICVGSYDRKVLFGNCLIVYAEKDGIYQACIEVQEQTNMVYQARAKYNADLQGDVEEAFRKWLKLSDLHFGDNSF